MLSINSNTSVRVARRSAASSSPASAASSARTRSSTTPRSSPSTTRRGAEWAGWRARSASSPAPRAASAPRPRGASSRRARPWSASTCATTASGTLALAADVADEAAGRRRSTSACGAELGRIDVLFNNAGISPTDDASVLDTSLEAWQRVQDVNLKSVFLCCKHGIPHLIAGGGGSVINTASFVATMGSATSQISYTASKGGVLAAVARAGRGVRPPGRARQRALPGPGQHAAAAGAVRQGPGGRRAPARARPDGRFAEVREIANAVALPRLGRVELRERDRRSWSTAASRRPTRRPSSGALTCFALAGRRAHPRSPAPCSPRRSPPRCSRGACGCPASCCSSALGMLVGSDGLGWIDFDDYRAGGGGRRASRSR